MTTETKQLINDRPDAPCRICINGVWHEAMVVPAGMTAADVRHRLEMWQWLLDAATTLARLLGDESDCISGCECSHGFSPPTECTNTECADRETYRDYEFAVAALAAADEQPR